MSERANDTSVLSMYVRKLHWIISMRRTSFEHQIVARQPILHKRAVKVSRRVSQSLDSFMMICSHVNTRTNVSVYHTYGADHTQKFGSDLFRYENRRIYLRAHLFLSCGSLPCYCNIFAFVCPRYRQCRVRQISHHSHGVHADRRRIYCRWSQNTQQSKKNEKRKMKKKNDLSRYYKASICPVARMEFLRDLWRENSNSFGVYFSH